MTAWTREALTYETMVRQRLSSRRTVGVTDAVRSVLALQAQEPAAPYLALWNRIDGFDANDLDRALADGAIVKASLFRFTLHAVHAGDLPWARAALQSRVRDAGYHDVLDDIGLTSERVDELAYADRSRVISDEHRPHVIRRNGDVLPTVVVEGLVRGVWRASTDAIEVRALEPLDDATLASLDEEARDLRRLLADREPAVFARFGRWWDRLPDGPTITIGS